MRIEWIEKYLKDAEQMIYSNEVAKGLDLLNDLLYDEPGYGSLHNHIGWAYLHYTADTERAELHLKTAIFFQPEFAPPYLHLGTLYSRAGRYTEAIAYFEKGMVLPSANKIAFCDMLGQAYELRGDFTSAIRVYKNGMLSSLMDHEINLMKESIRRCRKKRIAVFFTL